MSTTQQLNLRIEEQVVANFKEFVIDTKGSLNGHFGRMVEQSMIEYMDNDRFARIENNQQVIMERLFEGEGGTPSKQPAEKKRNFADDSDSKNSRVPSDTNPNESTGEIDVACEHDGNASGNSDSRPSDSDSKNSDRDRNRKATTLRETFRETSGATNRRFDKIASALPDNTTLEDDELDTYIEMHAGSADKTLRKYKDLLRKYGCIFENPINSGEYITSARSIALLCEANDKVTVHHIDSLIGQYEHILGEDWYLEALPDSYIDSNAGDLKYERIVGQVVTTDQPETAVATDGGTNRT